MTSAATKRYFLVGFMGVGKTTLGERVARELDLPFSDLDTRIERAHGASIPEIFARVGEPGFRRIETEALRALLTQTREGVVALGGGTFAVEANRALLREAGTSVWLDVPVDELLERVDSRTRPLWKSPEQARTLHSKRERAYALADHRIELAGLTTAEAQAKLRDLLANLSDER